MNADQTLYKTCKPLYVGRLFCQDYLVVMEIEKDQIST